MAQMLEAGKGVLNKTLFQPPLHPHPSPAPRMPTLPPSQGGARPFALITPYLLFRRALCYPATHRARAPGTGSPDLAEREAVLSKGIDGGQGVSSHHRGREGGLSLASF